MDLIPNTRITLLVTSVKPDVLVHVYYCKSAQYKSTLISIKNEFYPPLKFKLSPPPIPAFWSWHRHCTVLFKKSETINIVQFEYIHVGKKHSFPNSTLKWIQTNSKFLVNNILNYFKKLLTLGIIIKQICLRTECNNVLHVVRGGRVYRVGGGGQLVCRGAGSV